VRAVRLLRAAGAGQLGNQVPGGLVRQGAEVGGGHHQAPGVVRSPPAQAWQNIQTTLSQVGASLSDIVSVRQWLTSAEDIRAYVEVRNKFITHKPAALLGVIPGLVRPDFLIEIELVAAVPAGKVKRDQ
jgi:enamine deaminase RidA (YjgF/YER057c/UK114 family)